MPIKAENKHRYPANWREIRERILSRAKHRCEFCSVPNYAVGHRDPLGRFIPTRGNQWHDEAGAGHLAYSEAIDGVRTLNDLADDRKFIVIVLTIAHLDQKPENNDESNLRALCQRCHLRYDKNQHVENAKATRLKKADGTRPMLKRMEAA